MKIPALSVLTFLAIAPLIPSATANPIDPQALTALKRMSDTLSAAPALSFRAKTILEFPAATGQFITLYSTANLSMQRPNKLCILLGGEAPHFNFYYNGTTVSAYAPATNVYSTIPAPATINEMLAGLQAETGIRFPTAPLLFTNSYPMLTRGLFSLVVVGPAKVEGAICTHLAGRSPGVNWEVWIQNTPAVPRRMAVTFTDRTNFPRTIIEFSSWNLHPWLLAGSFTFHPPATAHLIPFNAAMKASGR